MANKKPKKSPIELPLHEFFGEYWEQISSSQVLEKTLLSRSANCSISEALKEIEYRESHSPELWETVRHWWPISVLRTAADKDAELFKRLLHYFLLQLMVKPPEGVFTPFRWPPGRPKEKGPKAVFDAWIAKKRPPLTSQVLHSIAEECYAAEYRDADASLRLKLRNRVRTAILHREPGAATKPSSIS